MPRLARQLGSLVVLGALGVLTIVASAAVLGQFLPEDSPTADALMVAVSILGTGIVVASPAVSLPAQWGERAVRRAVAAKLTGLAAMFVGGAAVRHLFGPEDSGAALLRLAIALWLPAVVLIGIGSLLRADPADDGTA